jgi:hypothetical protein
MTKRTVRGCGLASPHSVLIQFQCSTNCFQERFVTVNFHDRSLTNLSERWVSPIIMGTTHTQVSKHERGRLKLLWRNDPVALSALWWATMRFVYLVDGSAGKEPFDHDVERGVSWRMFDGGRG